jgi:hypothetical protein
MDIKKKLKWVFYGVSIEKKIQEGHHHRANFFFLLTFDRNHSCNVPLVVLYKMCVFLCQSEIQDGRHHRT